MKIVVIVRTRNEEKNVGRFCSAYQGIANKILVADANSTDRTREIARSYRNVRVRIFDKKKPLQNGYERNSHSEQINFLLDWAKEEKADWIIFDDCDCWPNFLMKEKLRYILEAASVDFVHAVRLYLWGNDKYFPKLAKPVDGVTWEAGPYAWKASTGLYCTDDEDGYHQKFSIQPKKHERINIEPPMCLLHNPWQDEEMVEQKLKFYRESGVIPNMLHPLEFGGPLEKLPDWARE